MRPKSARHEQQLNLQASALRQEWGGVVTEWATQNSAQLQHLLDRSDALVCHDDACRDRVCVAPERFAGASRWKPNGSNICLGLSQGRSAHSRQKRFVLTYEQMGACSGIESGGASSGGRIAEGSCDSGLGGGVVGGQGLGVCAGFAGALQPQSRTHQCAGRGRVLRWARDWQQGTRL